MKQSSGLVRWMMRVVLAGAAGGFLLAYANTPAMAEKAEVSAGCKCTISGGGSFSCISPSACTAGLFKCSVSCGEELEP